MKLATARGNIKKGVSDGRVCELVFVSRKKQGLKAGWVTDCELDGVRVSTWRSNRSLCRSERSSRLCQIPGRSLNSTKSSQLGYFP